MTATVKDFGTPAPAHGGGGSGGADPGSGYDRASGLWTDKCPVQGSIDWNITGDGWWAGPGEAPINIRVVATAEFPQEVVLNSESSSAETPTTQAEIGEGGTITVSGYDRDNEAHEEDPCADGNQEFIYMDVFDPYTPGNIVDEATCAPCGVLSFRNATSATYTVSTGKHGTIFAVIGYQSNSYCAQFFGEDRVEILLTDETGARGLRCGFARRIKSEWIKFDFSSDPTKKVSIPGYEEAFPLSGLKIPAELKWTAEGNYYIKTSCGLANSHSDADVASLPVKGIEIFTKPCTDAIEMTHAEIMINSVWKNESVDIFTTRTANDTCYIGKRCENVVDPSGLLKYRWAYRPCWFMTQTTYTWQIPGSNTYGYYRINESGIEAELAKHQDDFWRQLTNFTMAEPGWLKYPLFGKVDLGLIKRGATLELQLLGNKDYPVLRWNDPFVNRVLKVAAYSGSVATDIVSITDLDA